MTPEPAAAPSIGASRYRWVLLGGIWLVYFSFGLIAASMAPLVGPITADLGIDHTRMGAILGAWPLVYIAAAIPCGALLDRLGPRLVLLIGSVVISVSAIARGFAQDELTMFLAVGLFGIGGPLISIGAPKMVTHWFTGAGRGTAMGIYMTGPALGSAASLSLTNSLLMPFVGDDWRQVMFFYAAIALTVGIAWFAIASHPTAARANPVGGKQMTFNTRAWRHILSGSDVRIILAMGTGVFFINHGLNNWLPEILQAKGLSAEKAGFWASVPTMVGIVGSLVIPRFAVPAWRIRLVMLLFLTVTVSTLMLQTEAGGLLMPALVLLGIARGSLTAVVMLLLMEAPGIPRERLGLAGGMFFVAAEFGGVTGPFTVGALSDLTGTFDSALVMMTGVTVILAWLASRMSRPAVSPSPR